jgi:hypothetical protein
MDYDLGAAARQHTGVRGHAVCLNACGGVAQARAGLQRPRLLQQQLEGEQVMCSDLKWVSRCVQRLQPAS